MYNESKKYGTYYGELINGNEISEDFHYLDYPAQECVDALKELGVKEIFFDYDKDEQDEWADTMFFEVDKNTNMNDLLVYIAGMRPEEFSEESPNCFRMWFD